MWAVRQVTVPEVRNREVLAWSSRFAEVTHVSDPVAQNLDDVCPGFFGSVCRARLFKCSRLPWISMAGASGAGIATRRTTP